MLCAKRGEVAGEGVDDAGIGGAGVAEGEGPVDAADDRLDDPVGHRERARPAGSGPAIPARSPRTSRPCGVRRARSGRCPPTGRSSRSAARSARAPPSELPTTNTSRPVSVAELVDGRVDHLVPLRHQQIERVQAARPSRSPRRSIAVAARPAPREAIEQRPPRVGAVGIAVQQQQRRALALDRQRPRLDSGQCLPVFDWARRRLGRSHLNLVSSASRRCDCGFADP